MLTDLRRQLLGGLTNDVLVEGMGRSDKDGCFRLRCPTFTGVTALKNLDQFRYELS